MKEEKGIVLVPPSTEKRAPTYEDHLREAREWVNVQVAERCRRLRALKPVQEH